MTFIIENQHRPDGIINNSTVSRSTRENGLSYYYERKSKMIVTTQFTKVALMITDENLSVIESCIIDTQYSEVSE